MQRLVRCPHCAHPFVSMLPEVTPAEAEELKRKDDDRSAILKCPQCSEKVPLKHWDLPSLPPPP
jgi:DNA-directed RNA polymerase subunit RPC12/RpoP